MKRFVWVAAVLGVIFLLASCGLQSSNKTASTGLTDKEIIDGVTEADKLKERQHEREAQAKQPASKAPQKITVSAVGDILLHDAVYHAAKTESGYDFKPMFKQVKPYLKAADISFANQETMIGGSELGVSTYPRFNSPFEAGDALKDAGVDIVSIANNHTLDRGEEAIQRAIRHWDKIGVAYVGGYRDQQDQEKLRVIETQQGISVAFLAFTYGTNGLPVPDGKDYLVNLINRQQIAHDITRARQAADAVVLSLHFGDEYQRKPNGEQEELVRFAAEQGADVILGHHPHVLQPIEWVEGKGGGKSLVIYSLGNFISAQKDLYKQTGGILTWDFEKMSGATAAEVVHPRFMPTYVPYGKWAPEPMHATADSIVPNARQKYEEMKQHMSARLPELQFVEE